MKRSKLRLTVPFKDSVHVCLFLMYIYSRLCVRACVISPHHSSARPTTVCESPGSVTSPVSLTMTCPGQLVFLCGITYRQWGFFSSCFLIHTALSTLHALLTFHRGTSLYDVYTDHVLSSVENTSCRVYQSITCFSKLVFIINSCRICFSKK